MVSLTPWLTLKEKQKQLNAAFKEKQALTYLFCLWSTKILIQWDPMTPACDMIDRVGQGRMARRWKRNTGIASRNYEGMEEQ